PFWFEVPKSKRAPKAVEAAISEGADLILAWGGDGMVRRCVNAIGDSHVPLGILPAGTANLLANSLGIPIEPAGALRVALRGERRKLDVGRFEGERFVVMAGAGLDAAMIRDSDSLKDRVGRAAYVVGGAKNVGRPAFEIEVKVDGTLWYEGAASCLLIGNIGELFGGIDVFPDASPDDGRLDVGLLTAENPLQVLRAAARTAVGTSERSPFVRLTQAREVKVKLDRKVRYELDGGDRKKVKKFKIKIEPGAIAVCVPARGEGSKER
ncbi:MAG: NAD(+)/NADH kinase, partial [Actinobacteria bacterium]|nr:NAD(+)/NADH kinase [Actinomycetota bacterium]